MLKRSFTQSSLIAAAAVTLLAVSACGGSDANGSGPGADADSGGVTEPAAQPVDDAGDGADEQPGGAGAGGEAVLTIDGADYTATLAHCMLEEGGDALFHGVTHDESGQEVGYLDGDFTGLGDLPQGEVRIDFGATSQFDSTDEFVALGDAVGHIVVAASSDTVLNVVGAAWDQDGTALPTGTLRVTCGE